jgi:hypothetical protein
VDFKDLPSLSNQPQVRKPSTPIQAFQPLAITKRMFGHQKLSFDLLFFNQLLNPRPKSFIGAHRWNYQISKTPNTNLDLFQQIKILEARLCHAVLANSLTTACTEINWHKGSKSYITNAAVEIRVWVVEVKTTDLKSWEFVVIFFQDYHQFLE